MQCWLNEDHLLIRGTVESQISVRDVKLQLETGILGNLFNLLTEFLESFVQLLSELSLSLLFVHLVWIVSTTSTINLFTSLNNFSEELNIFVLLLSDHDWILEMEMDQDHDLVFTRLE